MRQLSLLDLGFFVAETAASPKHVAGLLLFKRPISHLHLSNCTFEEVALMQGLIGHIHLSDCDGKVHGDLPAGMGVTPIAEYLAAIRDTGYDGTVSIELEYSPDPDKIVEWAQRAYDGTAAIMRELGVRA